MIHFGKRGQFLYDVGATLGTLGVTTIITSEADPRDPTFFPETTAADVILGMHYTLQGVRQRRGLEVVKAHACASLRPASIDTVAPPCPFGMADLDALLGGGVPRATATLLAGSPGAGKTLSALHFAMAGVRAGE